MASAQQSSSPRVAFHHFFIITCIALLYVTMIDVAALIPSQVLGPKRTTHSRRSSSPKSTASAALSSQQSSSTSPSRGRARAATGLVPSQVLRAYCLSQNESAGAGESTTATTATTTTLAPSQPEPNKRRRQRNRRKKRQSLNTKSRKSKSSSSSPFSSSWSSSGNLPDIEWRSITADQLRRHPNFRPLPLPTSIRYDDLDSTEDVRLFRQSSWQWDALHQGRCTTSQAVAALGFLEEEAADVLGVPKSLRRGGLGAYHRLRAPAHQTLEDLQQAGFFDDTEEGEMGATNADVDVWTQPEGYPFAAKHMFPVDNAERDRRKRQTRTYSQSPGFDRSIRMMWGNTQEATAVLTALNYFWKKDPQITVHEVGMCGAGLTMNQTSPEDGLLVGATPDALLCHSDGTVEAVEVKNHCPFFSIRPPKGPRANTSSNTKRFRLRRMEFTNKVLPHYVPQLMMEMMCVGEECKSAVMIRQTASNGSLVMRMTRDDAWIDEMMYWLNRFQSDFVQAGVPPHPNFFFHGSGPNANQDHERYMQFLQFTKELESKVEVLAHLSNKEVQRADGTFPAATSLFLD